VLCCECIALRMHCRHLSARLSRSLARFPVDVSLDRLLDLARTYAPGFIFFGLALENTLFLAVIVPGMTILIIAGLLVHTGDVHPATAIAAGVLGTWTGDTINYAVGRWGLRRVPWVHRVLEANDDVHHFLDRYPRWVYIFFHFPVYLRTAFPLTLGSMRTPWRSWLWIDGIGAPLFVTTFIGLGYGLARYALDVHRLADAAREVTQVGNVVVLGFSLFFLVGTLKFIRLIWRHRHATPRSTRRPDRNHPDAPDNPTDNPTDDRETFRSESATWDKTSGDR
jgi:membrane protein DedA with SNARE-associated domain